MTFLLLAAIVCILVATFFLLRHDELVNPTVLPKPDYRESKIAWLKEQYAIGELDLFEFEEAVSEQLRRQQMKEDYEIAVLDGWVTGGCGTLLASATAFQKATDDFQLFSETFEQVARRGRDRW